VRSCDAWGVDRRGGHRRSAIDGCETSRKRVLPLASVRQRSHAEYVEGDSLVSMIKEDLAAERIAIDSYRDIIQYLGDQDPTTRRMMEESWPWKRNMPKSWPTCWW
jgi:hypothetical protein